MVCVFRWLALQLLPLPLLTACTCLRCEGPLFAGAAKFAQNGESGAHTDEPQSSAILVATQSVHQQLYLSDISSARQFVVAVVVAVAPLDELRPQTKSSAGLTGACVVWLTALF